MFHVELPPDSSMKWESKTIPKDCQSCRAKIEAPLLAQIDYLVEKDKQMTEGLKSLEQIEQETRQDMVKTMEFYFPDSLFVDNKDCWQELKQKWR